jgi:hypothetical protein
MKRRTRQSRDDLGGNRLIDKTLVSQNLPKVEATFFAYGSDLLGSVIAEFDFHLYLVSRDSYYQVRVIQT